MERAMGREAVARGNSPNKGNIAVGSCSGIAAGTAPPPRKRSGFRRIPVVAAAARAGAVEKATEHGSGGFLSAAFRCYRCFQYSPFPPFSLQSKKP